MERPINCTPSELSIYLRALAAGYLATHFSDISVSVPSKLNRTVKKYLQPDNETDSSLGSPFFQMSLSLMELNGRVLSMSSAEGSLARISAQPARAAVSPVLAQDYGVRWRALFTKYSRERSSWKTRRSLLDEGWTLSLPTLPRWGSMLDGVLWERVTLVRLTSETESGSLPTPVKYDAHGTWESNNYHGLGWSAKNVWSKETLWPTPIKSDAAISKTDYVLRSVERGQAFNQLAREVEKQERIKAGTWQPAVKPRNELWPTPVKGEARAGNYTKETSFRHFDERSHQVHLAQVVRDERMHPGKTRNRLVAPSEPAGLGIGIAEAPERPKRRRAIWSTPTATQPMMPPATLEQRMIDRHRGGNTTVPLQEQLQRLELAEHQNFPTPSSQNGLRGSSQSEHWPLCWKSPGHPEYGELNPTWTEWLMGWIFDWTSLDPLPIENMNVWRGSMSGDRCHWWDTDPSDENVVARTTTKDAPNREQRIAAIGNGQVPAVVVAAWHHLSNLEDPS